MVYYIMYNGQVTGPMTREQMASYGVTSETMVSANGGDWQPLYKFPELMEIASANPAPEFHGVQRQVGFGEAIGRAFKKYCCFSGRASRSEFWWWQLFTYILSTACMFVGSAMVGDQLAAYNPMDPTTFPFSIYIPSGILSLLIFLPSLGLTVRRLHDTGRSGWWVLLNALCCVGPIILLVWWCQPSEENVNEYGPVPNTES